MRWWASLLVGLSLACAPPLAAAEGWHSEQPIASGIEVPEPLGPVGDIEFQAPNRGVLITGGNGAMPAGVYAYDGGGWRLYSTVCGGSEGRIAWAGPDEFWTVSDQRPGQEGAGPLEHRSLCHFKDGQVIGSYAQPIGLAQSYEQMNAAACANSTECWFAGERLPGTVNAGAFHLRWDGAALVALPSLLTPEPGLEAPGRSVEDLAFQNGQLYESVRVQPGDTAPGESGEPSFLHRVAPGEPHPFQPLFPAAPLSYGSGVQPQDLDAFRFAAGGGLLWAVAGAARAKRVEMTVLQLGPAGFVQVPLSDPTGAFRAADRVLGAAAEPVSGDLWVSYRHSEDEAESAVARLARVHPDGSVDPPIELPVEGEGIGRKGFAGPIACPAVGQCWMATGRGWLFHLGGALPIDGDPAMHALITFRPPDGGEVFVPPDELPTDDSGAELSPLGPGEEELELGEELPHRRRSRALVAKVRQRLVDETVLELSFTLRARARVRLLAERRKKVVARTPSLTLGRGRHRLRLRLDRRRWPTHLDFQVHRVGARAGS